MINKHLHFFLAKSYAIPPKGIYVFASQEPSCILNQVTKTPTQTTCVLLNLQSQLYPLFLAKKL